MTGSQLRFNPNLLPLSSHAIIMECDLLDKGEKQRLRQDGRDALYRYEELPQYDQSTLAIDTKDTVQLSEKEAQCAGKLLLS